MSSVTNWTPDELQSLETGRPPIVTLLDHARLVADSRSEQAKSETAAFVDSIARGLESEAPAFEVINPYSREAFRIWANGHTDGFEKHGATLIINRIPQMLADA